MTADRKRPTGPPPSAGVLARHAQAYARELGVAEGRVRAWVSYMILAGVLERVADAGAPRFLVKGGVALELRLRDRARATKDIDIVLRDVKADLADSLEQALTGEAYQGFSFRRKGQPLRLLSVSVFGEGAGDSLARNRVRVRPPEYPVTSRSARSSGAAANVVDLFRK